MITITEPDAGAVFPPGGTMTLKGANGPPVSCTVKVAGGAESSVTIPTGLTELYSLIVPVPSTVGTFIVTVVGSSGKDGSRTFTVGVVD